MEQALDTWTIPLVSGPRGQSLACLPHPPGGPSLHPKWPLGS